MAEQNVWFVVDREGNLVPQCSGPSPTYAKLSMVRMLNQYSDGNSWDAVSAKGYTVREYRLVPVEEDTKDG